MLLARMKSRIRPLLKVRSAFVVGIVRSLLARIERSDPNLFKARSCWKRVHETARFERSDPTFAKARSAIHAWNACMLLAKIERSDPTLAGLGVRGRHAGLGVRGSHGFPSIRGSQDTVVGSDTSV